MKLSIWQQFSSNHSAAYTVVGEFDSPESAQQAEQKIRQLIAAVAERYKQRMEMESWRHTALDFLPIEAQFAQSYGINWQETLDWIMNQPTNALYHRQPEDYVRSFDHLLLVNAPGSRTWQSGHQFVDLMQAMNAKPYRHLYEGYESFGAAMFTEFYTTIACVAPSEDTATLIFSHLSAHLTEQDQNGSLQADTVLRETIELLRSNVALSNGTLKREGNHILLEKAEFGSSIVTALPALVTWMRERGCEATYQFQQGEMFYYPDAPSAPDS